MTIDDLVQRRAHESGVSVWRVRGRSRSPSLVRLRAWIAAELRAANFSLPVIGRALNRDHTTILNYLRD